MSNISFMTGKNWWRFLSIIGGLFLILSAFLIGLTVGQRLDVPNFSSLGAAIDFSYKTPVITGVVGVDGQLFGKVWGIIRERYFKREQIQDKDLFYGAISGLANSLNDPYTTFLDPKTAQKFQQDLTGEFEGIGAEIGIKNERLTIVAPLAESPAEKAGLGAGDLVWTIDKVDTSGITLDKAVSLIRGPAGTTVTLSVSRHGWHTPKDIVVTRDRIQVKSVTWKVLPTKTNQKVLGYIKIAQFNEDTRGLLEAAARDLLAKQIQGLIVDLRNNPGGLLDSAVDVASLWLPQGVIVKEKFSAGDDRQHERRGLLLLPDTKTVILVNQGSASAAEIVAGALQDYGRATLVGEKTFGKGSVQEMETFSDGSALKVTVATWYTPKDRQINELGIAPDVVVPMTADDYGKNIDPQLEKAKSIL